MSSTNYRILDQSAISYYKTFVNLLNIQSNVYANNIMVRYSSNKIFKTLTYSQVDRITTNLACEWAKNVKDAGVISYINDSGVNYMLTMIALMKLRSVLFVISPRNSEAAVTELLKNTKSKTFFAAKKYEAVARSAASKLGDVNVIIIDPLNIESLLEQPLNDKYNNIIDSNFTENDIDKPALIIHSSGSTNFPKPITISNRYLLNVIGCFKHYNEHYPHLDVINQNDISLVCLPLFHLSGIFFSFSLIYEGASFVYLEQIPASQKDIEIALKQNNCTIMSASPIIYEQMASYMKEGGDLSAVQKLKTAIYGGSHLKYEVGDWFQKNNINCRNTYGSTEMGICMLSNLDPKSANWYSLSPFCNDIDGKPLYLMEDAGDGLKHLYVRSNCHFMALGVSNREGGGYNSNDLFIENPESPGYYRYYGRRDDTLVMINGEKTNPVPMEGTIRQSPIVKQVAVLGHGRQCTSALIEVDLSYAIDFGPEEIISLVHEAVEDANVECPSHSVILNQMVKILPFSKSLPSTDKGSVIRKQAEAMYLDLVESMYANFINGPIHAASGDVKSWSTKQVVEFLVKNIAEVLRLPGSALGDFEKSVFEMGLNSLTAIQLRNSISKQFGDIPQNFLFQNPTISSMREFLMSASPMGAEEVAEKRYQQTQELTQSYIERAIKDFPVARNDYMTEKKEKVVLLTGATGSLGSFILRDLLKDVTVKKVYCLVRGKESQLYERVVEAFKSRSLDTSLLKTERLEVLPMRLSEPNLGWSKERYNQLKEEVTIIQHCAWLLDFNMTIEHYDKECISPFYNLLKFAYRQINPMHIHFISSVSASAASGLEIEEKPLIFDSHSAMPLGYAQSKFLCEILLNYLTREKNFPCYIERVGQVSGDSVNGVWNTTEQYPLLFISGGLMRKMPDLSTVIDWIPVDYAASTVVEIMLSTSHSSADEENSVFHIVNPRIEKWSDILEAMQSCGIEFDTIDPSQWVNELSKDNTIPSYRLMTFYEDSFKKDFKMPIWKTKKTSEIAPVITKSPIVDVNLFKKYLNHWKSVGFYKVL